MKGQSDIVTMRHPLVRAFIDLAICELNKESKALKAWDDPNIKKGGRVVIRRFPRGEDGP